MASLSADLSFRGLIYQVSDDSLLSRLDAGNMTAYIGFDPSGDSLHIGHLLQLCNLRRLQLGGHRPIVLAGGGTGMIGDPGGRSSERALLSYEEIEANVAAISAQLERFLDFSPTAGSTRALLLNNAEWLVSWPLVEFLRDIGKHFSVSQMVAKESVRSRMERDGGGISFTEFSYMLLQSADFLHLYDNYHCELQLGASDQWGNITMGIELIRKVRQKPAYALTSPLVLKADGEKFGKSESGGLYLDPRRTSPYALYQYLVRSEDSMVGTYLRYFTFLTHEEIEDLDRQVLEHPERRAAQRVLAREVSALVHGEVEALRAERAAEALYTEELGGLDEKTLEMVLEDVPSSSMPRAALEGAGLDAVEALVLSGLVASKSTARTTIAQGGAYRNNRRLLPGEALMAADLLHDRFIVLRRGRRDLFVLEFV